MGTIFNAKKPSKGDRLNWPSLPLSPINFDRIAKPKTLTEHDLAIRRQSKGKFLVP